MRKTIDRFKFNGAVDEQERIRNIRDLRTGIFRHKFWDSSEFEGQIHEYLPTGLGTFWNSSGWGFKGVWQCGILTDLIQVYFRTKNSDKRSILGKFTDEEYTIEERTFEEAYWSIKKKIEDTNRDWVMNLLLKKESIDNQDSSEYFDGNMKRYCNSNAQFREAQNKEHPSNFSSSGDSILSNLGSSKFSSEEAKDLKIHVPG
jgi:hypothetical protein